MDYLVLFLVVFGGAFVCGVVFGGLFLLLACWAFNTMLGAKPTIRRAESEEPTAPILKTTDAGPYTAPGVETTSAETPPPGATDSNLVPMPSYPFACAITFCVMLLLFTANAAMIEAGTSLARSGTEVHYYPIPVFGIFFLLAAGVHSAMLQTSFVRGLILTGFLLIPWFAVGLAVAAVCSA